MLVKIDASPLNINIIQVYAPTSDSSSEEIEQFYQELEQLLKMTKPHEITIIQETHQDELKTIWHELKGVYSQCLVDIEKEKSEEEDEEDGNGDDNVLLTVKGKFNSAYATFCRCNAKLREILHSMTTSISDPIPESPSTPVAVSPHGFKLPPCEIPIFNGDYSSWPTFRDIFTALCWKNSRLSSVEKLFHLSQRTTGEPHEIVSKVPLTNENFEVAWKNLCSRYENKRVLVNIQLKSLFNLPTIVTENGDSIKTLQRDINNCISLLKLYDIDVESWGPIFVFICCNRLPDSTLTLWEHTLSDKSEIPKWSDLDSFLTNRYRTLESVSEIRQKNSNPSGSSRNSPKCPSNPKHVRTFQNKVSEDQCKLCSAGVHSAVPHGGTVQTCFSTNSQGVLLSTALVNVSYNGIDYMARALLDSGSEGSFISEKIFKTLRLPFKNISAQISGLNNTISASVHKECSIVLTSVENNNIKVPISALVVPHLSNNLPSTTIDSSTFVNLPNIPLADPRFNESLKIDILLGADVLPVIMLTGVKRGICGSLMAQETVFGWILSGPAPCQSPTKVSTIVTNFCEITLDKVISRFWEVEDIPRKRILSPSESYCEDLYVSTTKRNKNGRYEVFLPFKQNFPNEINIGSSRNSAMAQFFRNEVRLIRTPTFKGEYDEVLNEYITLGHMIKVENDSNSVPSYYLPHHAVVRPESTTTKVRVVFNASSASSNGLSLNDVLYPDPSDLTALTPGHFLIGSPLLVPIDPKIDTSPMSIVNRWQRLKVIHQQFCQRWKDEYLKELHKRHKWQFPVDNLKEGMMVVIKEDNIPPNSWRLGRITNTFPGRDNLVRIVEVKTERGTITRPITKLVVIPLKDTASQMRNDVN
ncbi:uncharacterized protein [Musca autumnalis]|uniref:uncharacterized protein n=1 Tax=Musca autumnalis TaxID=221902 RepID=UPI003CF8AF2A